jgi:hypothetical protein
MQATARSPATALSTIPVGTCDLSVDTLRRVFGERLETACAPPSSTRKMEYSGAFICGVGLRWAAAVGELQPEPAAEEVCPTTVLIKLVDPTQALVDVNEAKMTRTMRSYEVEVAVLRDVCPMLTLEGIRVPRVFAAEVEHQPFRTLAVMECCTPEFGQHARFGRKLAVAALDWLARFHALGFAARRRGTLAESMVWPQGGHTSLANRPCDEVDQVAVGFERLRANFVAADEEFIQPSADLGIRLQRVARQVDQWLAESTCHTLSHGDFKAGNIFIKNESVMAPEICVIDWQWTGWNVPQQDLIYFLSTSVDDDCVTDWRGLLQQYHEMLVASLRSPTGEQGHGAGAEQAEFSLSFEETMRLFQLAVLDYMRWALAYRLVDET